jgi:hypothetical protein
MSSTTYIITTITGNASYAGTGGKIHITLYGNGAQYGGWLDEAIWAGPYWGGSDNGEPPTRDTGDPFHIFQLGQTNVFPIHSRDLGELKKIRIGNPRESLGWFLNTVTILNENTGQE